MRENWSEEEELLLMKHFPTSTAKEMQVLLPKRSVPAIYTKAEQKQIRKAGQWDAESEQKLLENYTQVSTEALMELFPDRTYNSLEIKAGRLLREAGMLRKNPRYTVNDKFFREPTVLSSYWAGFIAADGNIYRNQIKIELQHTDSNHLHRFVKDIGFNGKVNTLQRDFPKGIMGNTSSLGKTYKYVKVVVSSKQWVRDLDHNFNITPKKSLSLVSPNISNILYRLSYIVGYIDGDGSIAWHKGSGCHNGYWCIYLTGTESVLTFVKNTLNEVVKPNELMKQPRITRTDNIYKYGVSGNRALDIIKYLSKLEIPRLSRKWDISRRQPATKIEIT